LLVVPMLRRDAASVPARSEFDMAVYRDQLAEVDRDVERGLLDPEQADAARLEVKRRMLAAAGETSSSRLGPRAGSFRSMQPMISVILVSVIVPSAAFGLYLVLGMPRIPDQPLAARQGTVQTAESPAGGSVSSEMTMEEAVARLASRLEANPGDLRGWLLLGRSYLSMERYPDAVEAYGRAFGLAPGRSDVASAYGEALVAAAGGEVTFDATEAFSAAAAQDPLDPRARYYLALHGAQQGDTRSALQGWIDLVAISPPDSPWFPVVNQQIARAAEELGVDAASIKPSAEAQALAEAAAFPAPSQADRDAAAGMSEQARETMVRSMVDRLASRLEAEPDDLAGWQRLARAYEVLGEAEKAQEARARAEALQRR
jgi:cytochrome c-type biogenesis protein CcmH